MILALTEITMTADESSNMNGADEGSIDEPVQVFIIMGQSNTLEMGKVKGEGENTLEHAVQSEGLYPFLVDESGKWTMRKDVRNVHVMGSGGPGKISVKRNEWLTVSGKKVGIEMGIGYELGEALQAPVLILKSAIGNRSLGWDLLPPGSESYEFTDSKNEKTYHYAGYGQSPVRWEKGSQAEPLKWTAGVQYAGDVARAQEVLANLESYYPGATSYEVAGFLWWQGDKDRYDAGHASRYERNLVNLISALRKDFNAPDAKFVCATLGQTKKEEAKGNEKLLLEAMLNLSDSQKHPALEGQVATVYTNPLSKGSSSNAHYGGHAQTYLNVGMAMGKAMVELCQEN